MILMLCMLVDQYLCS